MTWDVSRVLNTTLIAPPGGVRLGRRAPAWIGPAFGMSLTVGASALFWVGLATRTSNALSVPLSDAEQVLLAGSIVVVLMLATWRLFFKD